MFPNKAQELVDLANTFVGVKEQGGDNCGPEVEMFQRTLTGTASRQSWCMSFIQYCVKNLEKKYGVKSSLFKSEHCLTVWNKTPKEYRLAEPEVGCVVIWNFVGTSNGHAGIVTKVLKDKIETIEGNTSGPSAAVVREGDEVAAKSRSRAGSKTMKIVGYLKVF